jgi:flagellar motor switch/type III secretory pathway protein FliN
MEPVLTQEELEAIYSAMRGDASAPKAVDDYVLASDRAFGVRAARSFADAAKRMLPGIESVHSGLRAGRGRFEILEIRTIDEDRPQEDAGAEPDLARKGGALGEVDPTTEAYAVTFAGTTVFVGIDRAAARGHIARRTGAAAAADPSREEARALTTLERRLLVDVVRDFAEAIRGAMPGAPEPAVVPGDPDQLWSERAPRGLWVEARFGFSGTGATAFWIKGAADAFAERAAGGHGSLAQRLKGARISLSAELGTFRMSVYDLWHLKPGALIPLGVAIGDPIRVKLGGVPKLEGEPLMSRGNLAVRLLGRQKSGAGK